MSRPQTEPSPHAWVDAAPFRAHLEHLVEASGVPWSVIAVHAGIPTGLASRLRHRPAGRPLQRIPAHLAKRLLDVTPEVARSLRNTRVPAAATVRRLTELLRRGWSTGDVADALNCPQAEIDALTSPGSRTVPLARAHRIEALLAASDRMSAGRRPYAA